MPKLETLRRWIDEREAGHHARGRWRASAPKTIGRAARGRGATSSWPAPRCSAPPTAERRSPPCGGPPSRPETTPTRRRRASGGPACGPRAKGDTRARPREFRGVAQFGSALRSGRRGRWFESSRPDHSRRRNTPPDPATCATRVAIRRRDELRSRAPRPAHPSTVLWPRGKDAIAVSRSASTRFALAVLGRGPGRARPGLLRRRRIRRERRPRPGGTRRARPE